MKLPSRCVGLLSVLVGVLSYFPGQAWAQGSGLRGGWRQAAPGCGDAEQRAADRALGQTMAQQELATGMVWTGARVNEYVSRLGQNLARSSGSERALTFGVLYSRELNAETLPGGFIFINSAVISVAENEAELAAVLAHEIAHVNNCDWHRRERKVNIFARLMAIPLGMEAGPTGVAASLESVVSPSLAEARFSRAMEQEADHLAIQYLLRAGYDPGAVLKIFERLEAQSAGQVLGSQDGFADHPSISARQRALKGLLARLPATPRGTNLSAPASDPNEFQEVRNEILRYDEIYSEVVGLPLPGALPSPPKLQRRPVDAKP